jgi:hypothetical protein
VSQFEFLPLPDSRVFRYRHSQKGVSVMQVFQAFARPAGQDRRYFPLGTSNARPAVEPNWRKDPEKFAKALAKMLGSRAAADEYMRRRPYMVVRYGWER